MRIYENVMHHIIVTTHERQRNGITLRWFGERLLYSKYREGIYADASLPLYHAYHDCLLLTPSPPRRVVRETFHIERGMV